MTAFHPSIVVHILPHPANGGTATASDTMETKEMDMLDETATEDAEALLEEYDAKKRELWQLEQKLNRACSDYGRRLGLYGFSPTHLRQRLNAMKESKAR